MKTISIVGGIAWPKRKYDEGGRLLTVEAKKLKAAGADFFLLTCNTVNTADHYITSNVDYPMLHIGYTSGFKTAGLLGSRYTMSGTYFVRRLEKKYNLNVLVANGQHEANVHNALYHELAKNIFLPETQKKFKSAIADFIARGAEVIILACTEFGMLVHVEDSEVPIIDTCVVHAEAAVDLALSLY
ncbi:aspartate/glutamate racemase family protein [Aspergillus novofumigatus IBT 16806]|uniref:Asp/Glu racemase n=1 Tax=Aspergillus novofumigatus (strain IBT 16806) TaxID=1392255 RepID=A0A2I1CB81_ASPN1|nr:Asp/Glu racemase [Aspergillus novofumigatus IBT 16806]PKX94836.1 Asp/Glu racemase [Aspergillus novofumigatus IBT 16806]